MGGLLFHINQLLEYYFAHAASDAVLTVMNSILDCSLELFSQH